MLTINEVFYAPQGEGIHLGTPMVFVRFQGCNMKCAFCDTAEKNAETGIKRSVVELLLDIRNRARNGNRICCLTGGEPTIQPIDDMVKFCEILKLEGFKIHLETNGREWVDWLPLVDWISISPKEGDFYNETTKHYYVAPKLEQNLGQDAPVPFQVKFVVTMDMLKDAKRRTALLNQVGKWHSTWAWAVWLQCDNNDPLVAKALMEEGIWQFPRIRLGIQQHKVYGLR